MSILLSMSVILFQGFSYANRSFRICLYLIWICIYRSQFPLLSWLVRIWFSCTQTNCARSAFHRLRGQSLFIPILFICIQRRWVLRERCVRLFKLSMIFTMLIIFNFIWDKCSRITTRSICRLSKNLLSWSWTNIILILWIVFIDCNDKVIVVNCSISAHIRWRLLITSLRLMLLNPFYWRFLWLLCSWYLMLLTSVALKIIWCST